MAIFNYTGYPIKVYDPDVLTNPEFNPDYDEPITTLESVIGSFVIVNKKNIIVDYFFHGDDRIKATKLSDVEMMMSLPEENDDDIYIITSYMALWLKGTRNDLIVPYDFKDKDNTLCVSKFLWI